MPFFVKSLVQVQFHVQAQVQVQVNASALVLSSARPLTRHRLTSTIDLQVEEALQRQEAVERVFLEDCGRKGQLRNFVGRRPGAAPFVRKDRPPPKTGVAPNYLKPYGFFPWVSLADNTTEILRLACRDDNDKCVLRCYKHSPE